MVKGNTENPTGRNPPLPRHVHRAVCYLQDNLHRKIELSELIRVAGVAERTLHEQFRQILGMPPWTYLRRIRLLAARRALSESTVDPIAQIATRVGYTHLSRFARDYRAYFGELPSETKRQVLAEALSSPRVSRGGAHRPSLAILPFYTETAEERRMAEALTETLAASLSGAGVAGIIYARPADPHRPLHGSCYNLMGRFTRAGGIVRVTIRLVGNAANNHVWGENFDGTAQELLALQDRVANRVLASVPPALTQAEIDRLLEQPASALGARQIALRAVPLALAADIGIRRNPLRWSGPRGPRIICRTVIMVSHRLSSLVAADAIVVLDRGRIADCGRHSDLLSRCIVSVV